jgi:hypothetical protein
MLYRVVFVGAVFVVAGCGSSGDARPDVGALAARVTQQTAGKSAHVAFAMTSGAEQVTGEGGYRVGPDLAADFNITAAAGPTRFIMLDKTIYLQRPGQTWVRYAGNRPEVSQLAASMVGQTDIGAQIAKLRTAGTVTGTADETIEGRPATRYAIDVDVAKLAAAEPDPVLRAALNSLHDKGTSTLPYILWLDRDNLPVRTSITGPASVTATYTHWGEPLEVNPPPADQITDAPTRT